MRAIAGVTVVLLFASGAGRARADGEPASAAAAAEAALDAFRRGDGAGLAALAARDEPDPWLVVDDLHARNEHAAAVAFAGAAPRADTAVLPGYAASRRAPDDQGAVRVAVADAERDLDHGDAARAMERIAQVSGRAAGLPAILLGLRHGQALRDLRRWRESAAVFLEAANRANALGWVRAEAWGLHESGQSSALGSDLRATVETWRRRLAIEERRGRSGTLGAALTNLGGALTQVGEYREAGRVLERAAEVHRGRGDAKAGRGALQNLANVHLLLGDREEAKADYERALASSRADHDGVGEGRALAGLAVANDLLCRYPEAFDAYDRAARLLAAAGEHRAQAQVFSNLGALHLSLGDPKRATAALEQARAIQAAAADAAGEAATLRALASAAAASGRAEDARRFVKEARSRAEALRDPVATAQSSFSLAGLLANEGKAEEAVTAWSDGLAQLEALGRGSSDLDALLGRASALATLGRTDAARADFARVAEVAGGRRDGRSLARALAGNARLTLDAGDEEGALEVARRAMDALEQATEGLADPQQASARGRMADAFEVAAAAAARCGDAAVLLEVLERSRARALLESVQARAAIQEAVLPPDLARAHAAVRRREQETLARLALALVSGDVKETRARREEHDRARDAVAQNAERVQREAKRAAGVFRPRIATLAEVRGTVSADEARVHYSVAAGEVIALVVTSAEARIVRLQDPAAVVKAAEALAGTRGARETGGRLAELRKLAADPLELPEAVRRLEISPDGPLSQVPMAALFPGRTVSFFPSATLARALAEDAIVPGEGVLALGDPDLGPPDGAGAAAAHALGIPLVRLEGTRKEAEAFGDETLLGPEATEAGLRDALARRPRWHGVHFGCYGVVDADRPLLSCLVLSPSGEDDGLLTGTEVFRMRVPTDLAVLSACDTGRGRPVPGEGLVGLAHAFLFAGASRVLVSLWKVDDAATRALMERFYARWRPRDGSPPLAASEALRDAQAFVAAQDRWRDPVYWAAWQLWGLP